MIYFENAKREIDETTFQGCMEMYSDWPVRCNLSIFHLGNHNSIDNRDFAYVPFLADVASFQWPNVNDERFGEMNDMHVLAGQRVEFAGRYGIASYSNGPTYYAPNEGVIHPSRRIRSSK